MHTPFSPQSPRREQGFLQPGKSHCQGDDFNLTKFQVHSGRFYQFTYTPSFQKQLALAQAVWAVGELNQGFLCLEPCRGVCGLIELLAQVLELG